MMADTVKYYQSHGKLDFIGPSGQQKLGNARVLVIGAGGLGCPCLTLLAGSGIGHIGIADFDTVAISNLHRQNLYTVNEIGLLKTTVARQKLLSYNPNINVVEHRLLVDESNVLALIKNYHLVVDCTDNFMVRYLINDACVYLDKSWVYGAIYQAEGHITVFNYAQSGTLRCLFPEPDAETHVPSCAEVGAYNVLTQMIGSLMANEVIKVVLNYPSVLINKLLTFDALSVQMRTIGYKTHAKSRAVALKRFETARPNLEIAPGEFVKLAPGSYYLFDVREDWERDDFNIGGVHLPLHQLDEYRFDDFAKTEKLIFYCQTGQRSMAAVNKLKKMGFTNTLGLHGGINYYQLMVD